MRSITRVLIILLPFLFFMCRSEESSIDPIVNPPAKDNSLHADETIIDGNITIYKYTKEVVLTIISIPDTVYYLYMPMLPSSVESIGKESNWRYLINATYFSGPRSNAKHVGWLRINGHIYEPISDDKQLTHVARIDRHTGDISFTYYKDFIAEYNEDFLEFQTGPLVVENNKVAEDYIRSSINGLRTAERTLLASTDNKHLYFIICKSYKDLISIGSYLIKLSPFARKRLNVINLDGGPSTALYSNNYSKLNYNSAASLPFLLGIH